MNDIGLPISDLTECDREPIHILGAIQPFGFLLSISSDWLIARASDNVEQFLGRPHGQIVGESAETCLSGELLHEIRTRLQVAGGMGIVERLYGQRLRPGAATFDIAIHQAGAEVVLEFEPSTGDQTAPLAVLRTMSMRVERQTSLPGIFREVARQVRALTGFDRVMVYRFDDDGTGDVVAEAANNGLEPYLGLRYPASDIPLQARALYEKNYLRIIADVDAKAVPVLPALSPDGAPLDLTMSGLRSVSPVHLEYLRNMGVRTSMSISILQGGRLWGLIACHHGTAKYINLETRSTAELFGQMVSYLLESRERQEEARFDVRAGEVHSRIAAAFSNPDAALRDMPEFISGIPDFIEADGIGIVCGGEVNLVGITPTNDEFLDLVRFLNKTPAGRVFSTFGLSDIFPPAAAYAVKAAGILAIPISRISRDYLVFFRREVIETVIWAGQPVKTPAPGAPARLSPRKSFDAWQELFRNRCERWTKREIHAAEALRITLIELVLRINANAEATYKQSQQTQEVLIAELNHRVRNILGLVRGLVSQSASTAQDVTLFLASIDQRLGSLARAHDLLSSHNGKPGSLHELLRFEVSTYGELANRLVLTGPDILLPPKSFTAMALIVHELVTNARKYGALSVDKGIVTVGTSLDQIDNVLFSWVETGGPRVKPPSRRGFGSTLIEQLIPFEMNGISKPQYLPAGFVLDALLPATMAAAALGTAASKPIADAAPTAQEELALIDLLRTCLIVEDNLFIALDAEDMLRTLGAGKLVAANSIGEARNAMAREKFSFALLDVNLGADTSLPVAKALRDAGVPFAFGTGYGEALSLPEAMASQPVVSKPYHRTTMMAALLSLLRSA